MERETCFLSTRSNSLRVLATAATPSAPSRCRFAQMFDLILPAQRANQSFTHNRSAMPVHYIEFGITEQQRSAAISRQQLVKRNRQVADTDAGRVITAVSDGSSGAGDPALPNPFRTPRVEIRVALMLPGHIDVATTG